MKSIIITIIISMAFTGCTNISQPNQDRSLDTETPIFPTADAPATEAMEALLTGELSIDENDCVRVEDFLVVWPYEFSLRKMDGEYTVFDNESKAIASIGDQIKMGGGSSEYSNEKCAGPYWIAGDGIIKVE